MGIRNVARNWNGMSNTRVPAGRHVPPAISRPSEISEFIASVLCRPFSSCLLPTGFAVSHSFPTCVQQPENEPFTWWLCTQLWRTTHFARILFNVRIKPAKSARGIAEKRTSFKCLPLCEWRTHVLEGKPLDNVARHGSEKRALSFADSAAIPQYEISNGTVLIWSKPNCERESEPFQFLKWTSLRPSKSLWKILWSDWIFFRFLFPIFSPDFIFPKESE